MEGKRISYSSKASHSVYEPIPQNRVILISPVVTFNKEVSMDTPFQYNYPSGQIKNELPGEYTLIATGDVIPARSVNAKMEALHDFTYPFKKTADFLKNADLVFINLESPLIPNCQPTEQGMIFCGNQTSVFGLLYAGVTVANIANNHMGNYGIKGITETENLLLKNNIQVTGNGNPAISVVKGKKFGFLGYNEVGGGVQGLAQADVNKLQQDIKELKRQVDFVIVAFHWGVEYTSIPTQQQKTFAHTAIDAGADLIIGNHPHWVQAVEQYKGKFITYAHGNFVFDQMWSQETREGVLGKYTFNDAGLTDVKFYPIIIEDYVQPRFASQTEAEKILTRMKTASQKINTN